MNREKFATIGIGLLVGIVLAGGYLFIARILPDLNSKNSANNISVQPSNPESKTASPSSSFSLDKPDDYSSTAGGQIQLIGQAPAGSNVLIFASVGEKIATTEANGKFSAEVTLEDGENIITLTLLDKTKNTIIRHIFSEIKQ